MKASVRWPKAAPARLRSATSTRPESFSTRSTVPAGAQAWDHAPVESSPARVIRDADRRMLAGVAAALAQVALGVGLVVAGVAVFLVATPSVESPSAGILATAAITVGLVMVFGPWWWRLTHDLAVALQRVSDEIEDLHGVAVETVAVGDCPVDDHLAALVLSNREALANAA